jgi:hypothetical protein
LAADNLGKDKIPEYDVEKPARASSVPAAPPVSAKQVEDYLDKTAAMKMPPTATKTPLTKTRSPSVSGAKPRSASRNAKKPKLALREPSPHHLAHHHHLQMIGVA